MKRQVNGKTKEKASPRMFIIRKTTIDGLVDVGLSHQACYIRGSKTNGKTTTANMRAHGNSQLVCLYKGAGCHPA